MYRKMRLNKVFSIIKFNIHSTILSELVLLLGSISIIFINNSTQFFLIFLPLLFVALFLKVLRFNFVMLNKYFGVSSKVIVTAYIVNITKHLTIITLMIMINTIIHNKNIDDIIDQFVLVFILLVSSMFIVFIHVMLVSITNVYILNPLGHDETLSHKRISRIQKETADKGNVYSKTILTILIYQKFSAIMSLLIVILTAVVWYPFIYEVDLNINGWGYLYFAICTYIVLCFTCIYRLINFYKEDCVAL